MSMQEDANGRSIIRNLYAIKRFTEPREFPANAALCKYLSKQLIRGAYSDSLFIDLGDKLIGLAEQSYGLRDEERIEELSQLLLALPLPAGYKSAARFFHGLALRRRGQSEKGNLVLEEVAAEPFHRYTARALQSLGAAAQDSGDFESALERYLEADRRAVENRRVDYATVLFTQKNIATIKGLTGDHRRAVAGLEPLLPFVRAVRVMHPHFYYDYFNSLAVELGNLGRLDEAARASRMAVASPFSAAYPEWRETFDEIKLKRQRASRSAVAVPPRTEGARLIEIDVGKTDNLLHLPLSERLAVAPLADWRRPGTGARVLSFQQRKTTANTFIRPIPGVISAEHRNRMTTGEKLIRLMDLISQDDTDDETIDRILEAVEEIVLNRRNEKLT